MKFLLDSGDPQEYKELSELANLNKNQLWGSTTNPSLIAKKLSGKKVSQKEAYELQKQIVLEILHLVEGAVSAEVYADKSTPAEQMIEQGMEISKWNNRVVVKLPTNLEGLKARTELRKQGVPINNTLVFSQQQIFAICLHEKLIQQLYNPKDAPFPPFISPFVGRLDDKGLDGMQLVEYGMEIKNSFDFDMWMLESSVRSAEHIKRGILAQSDIATIPAKVMRSWLEMSDEEKDTIDPFEYSKNLKEIEKWEPSDELKKISSLEQFIAALETNKLDIQHELTDTGLERFAADWNALII